MPVQNPTWKRGKLSRDNKPRSRFGMFALELATKILGKIILII